MEKLKEKERELKKKKVQKGSYQRNKTVSTFRGGRDRDKDRNRTINNSKIYQENKSMGHFLRKDKDNRKKIDLKYITFTPRRGEEKSKSFLISKTDARLLNEIIGFDIDLMKKFRTAYFNNNNELLSKISDGMDSEKKALFQNIFKKMDVNIQL